GIRSQHGRTRLSAGLKGADEEKWQLREKLPMLLRHEVADAAPSDCVG
ncbi:MAG: hypothetical protein JWR65_1229, partial [Massilia sp.]|nr:hypothetical protein [Massilia sp.]